MAFRENAILTFLDDKATVPVGETLHAASANVRTHNRSRWVENVVIEALDDDWKVCVNLYRPLFWFVTFLIPSKVPLLQVHHTLLQGKRYLRNQTHSAMQQGFRANYPTDGISLDKQILLTYSDGGADYNVTFNSTRICLISLFLQLDVDMLVALRCCPLKLG